MKRLFLSICVILATLVASDGVAAAPAKSPLKAGDDAYAFDVSFRNSSGEKDTSVTGTWLHYMADNHRAGVNLLYLNNDAVAGGGAGPSYEFLFPMLQHGRLFVGGDATGLTGDLDQAGAVAAAARFGYEFYVGNSSAVRIQAHQFKVVNPYEGGISDQVDNYGVTIGIMLGAPAGVAVN